MNLTNFLLYGVCGVLNKNGPYRLLDLNACSLVDVLLGCVALLDRACVTLLKGVFPWGVL